jgi:hypothetical protein
MKKLAYSDKEGRVYRYGEFFPIELSPFGYNETVAQEYFSINEEVSLATGYAWKEKVQRNYEIEFKATNLPDNIQDVNEDIVGKVISCLHFEQSSHENYKCDFVCTEAFRITVDELSFYKRMHLPLPRYCPNCRHYSRQKNTNPTKLWHRRCQCAGGYSDNELYQNTASHFHGSDHCSNKFETSYSPERPETVYCEKCYQEEVY